MLIGTKGETAYETFFAVITLLITFSLFAYIISEVSMII